MKKMRLCSIALSLLLMFGAFTPIYINAHHDDYTHHYCDADKCEAGHDLLGMVMDALGITTMDELSMHIRNAGGYLRIADVLGAQIVPFCVQQPNLCCSWPDLFLRSQDAVTRDNSTLIYTWFIWCGSCWVFHSATDFNRNCICHRICLLRNFPWS